MVQCAVSLLGTAVATLLLASGVSSRTVALQPLLQSRAYCTNAKQVVAGNTCENIADKRCTISLATFKSYNPQLDCNNLREGQNFCCNEGTVPRDPDCTNSKTVVEGNTCESIADKRCTVSLATFKSYNPQLDCSNLKPGQIFCCNPGAVPLPDCTNIKTVVEGNTCSTIADKRCTISLSKFQDYNPHIDCSKLEPGAKVCCMEGKLPPLPQPNADGTCSDIQVAAGDSCATLYQKCGITPSLLSKYNPATNFCATLREKQWICCSSGTLKDRRPKNNADGSCATYTVQKGDSCGIIEANNGMSPGELDTFNKKKTWGWAGCDKLWPDAKICLSSGTPPMPAPIANAVCGPQKPGTVKPPTGTNISTLNPCPLNTCCNIWGQCGTTKEFCEITGDGTPGTGTCVNNCGMNIVNNAQPPAQFRKIGYFEAWNPERPCLWMDASSIDESKFTHVHFAFADITDDFQVDVSKVQAQFNKFKALKTAKRIVAFGGWTASTSPTTFHVFRTGVNSANRGTLANNIANFVKQHGLDGADIDWEYPGAPDMPDIPPAEPIDGPNYLAFLKLLRAALPTDKSLSIAAPASYWYLRAFPIKDIGNVVDYIVYMTYDLHGQWDAGSKWSQDGCPNGMCLRSHVNMTETYNALVMITKAGVPANKVIVGVSSYGRAFKMKDPNCKGDMCQYTGTAGVSEALPGPCTGTRGYIANAEIEEFIAIQADQSRPDSLRKRADVVAVEHYYDRATESNIAIINGTWVAYMDAFEKSRRTQKYQAFNLGGTTDWAHDLEAFTDIERRTAGPVLQSRFTNKGVLLGNSGSGKRWYDISCDSDAADDAEMDRQERWEGVLAEEAWADAIKAYETSERSTGSFSSWIIGVFFHGSEDVHCGRLLPGNNCLSRQDTCFDKDDVVAPDRTGPAGKFIANSFVQLEQAFVNYYDAIRGARSDVAGLVATIESRFMQEDDNTFQKQLGWNILGALTAVAGGPLFERLFQNPLLEKAAESAALGIVATGKDKDTGNVEDELSKAANLEIALNVTMTGWEKMITGFAAKVFSGETDGNGLLSDFMAHGALIPGGVPRVPGAKSPRIMGVDEMKALAKHALFMYIIPEAWRHNKDANVAILDTGRACGDFSDYRPENIYSGDAKKVELCFDNKQYLMLGAIGKERCSDYPPGAPSPTTYNCPWSTPPGLDNLQDFGLTYQDIMTASLRTWTKNNKQNGYKFDPESLVLRDFFDDSDEDKVLDLGMVRIPVCHVDEARRNWGFPSADHRGEFYPC